MQYGVIKFLLVNQGGEETGRGVVKEEALIWPPAPVLICSLLCAILKRRYIIIVPLVKKKQVAAANFQTASLPSTF